VPPRKLSCVNKKTDLVCFICFMKLPSVSLLITHAEWIILSLRFSLKKFFNLLLLNFSKTFHLPTAITTCYLDVPSQLSHKSHHSTRWNSTNAFVLTFHAYLRHHCVVLLTNNSRTTGERGRKLELQFIYHEKCSFIPNDNNFLREGE
jgi:hypothetical protein